jgi:SAM-dependent methyltransferase
VDNDQHPARRWDPAKVRADFDRLAGLSEDGWDHNAHYHAFLLGQLPTRCGQALDVGCGTGSFARLLAGRCDQVLGIDLSPRMVAVAIPAPQPSRPGREPPGRAREPAAAAAPQRPPG